MIFFHFSNGVSAPDGMVEFAEPIQHSKSSINAFSCAEIVKTWKEEDVAKYLRIGHRDGLRFLDWQKKAALEQRVKVGMHIAGFWILNLNAGSVSQDFLLGRVSADVSTFLNQKELQLKLRELPPANSKDSFKSEQSGVQKIREKLFSDYQCAKLK